MKRASFIPILAILVLSCFAIPVKAPIIPHEYTLDIPCYAPTKITFNYAYTHNHSIYDIHTFGASLYTHTGGPTYYEFVAQDIDDYHFTLEISYASPTNQTILVGIWSGNLPMQGINLESLFEHIVIYVRLRVQNQPTYPTDEEVAQQVVVQIQKSLEEQQATMTELIKTQNTTIYILAGVAGICVIAIIVVAVVVATELRTFRRLRVT